MPHFTFLKGWTACLLCGCLAFSAEALIGQGSDSSFLPLRVGNKWTFVRDGVQKTEKIIDTVRVKQELYYRFDTLSYETNVLVREAGPRVYRYLDTSEVLWYDFAADSGAVWTIPMEGQMIVERTSDTVRVPAGDFQQCRRFRWDPGPDAGATEWF